MITKRTQQTGQALFGLLACFFLGSLLDQAGEFAGGSVTEPLFQLADIGWVVLAVAILLTWWRPRVGAAVALAGCALWVPMIVYLLAHGAADLSLLAGAVSLAATAVVSALAFTGRRDVR